MFYVKTVLAGGSTAKTEITDENTYCTCPKCGKEVHVDLEEFSMICGGEVELYGKSAIWCDECSEKKKAQNDKPNFLCAVDPETGTTVHLDTAHFVIDCCDCDAPHPIDLDEIISTLGDNFTSIGDIRVYCEKCTARRQAARES